MMENLFEQGMLENISACPVCGGNGHKCIAAKDLIFFSGGDTWVYSRCVQCCSVYLSERPKSEYIIRAYERYYTHSDRVGLVTRCVRFLVAAYVGRNLIGAAFRAVARALYPVACFFDARSRNIRCWQQGKLFDYGCGNGEFLSLCRGIGIEVEGADLDSDAIKHASSRGLKVQQGGVEVLKEIPSESFDWVTISHVIEHVYEFDHLLAEFNRILRPGGKLWIETPNGTAAGLEEFSQYWRGLEPPRHLLLFSRRALLGKLHNNGFEVISERYHFLSGLLLYVSSERIRKQAGVSDAYGIFGAACFGVWRDVRSFFCRDRAELITLLCQKK